MTKVNFYDSINDSMLKFAVIIARHNGKWVFCKHKERNTWEAPGGHREDGEDILEKLSRIYKIGVIANQSLGTSERLENLGVRKYIDLIIASAEEGVSKPDRRIFEIALERSCCKPENAVMIGDRIDNDIVPAKQLGMKTIWVKQGLGSLWNITDESEKADMEINNLSDVLKYL